MVGHLWVGVGLVLSSNCARSDDFLWRLATSGAFEDPKNWSDPAGGVGPPGSEDNAIFEVSGLYTVSFGDSPTNEQLLIHNGELTFDLGGQVYTLTIANGTDSIIVGQECDVT